MRAEWKIGVAVSYRIEIAEGEESARRARRLERLSKVHLTGQRHENGLRPAVCNISTVTELS